MKSFNVKIFEYSRNNEEEIRIYKKPIETDFKVEGKKKKKDNRTIHDEVRSVKESSRRSKDMIYRYARANSWEWFVTLTFNPAIVDSFNYDEVTKKLSKWLDNTKSRKCPNMAYIGVPELHQSGRYHFHLLMSGIENLDFLDSGKKDNKGRPIYNIGNYKFGWTTATAVTDSGKASNYLSKYITDGLVSQIKNKRRYWSSKNLEIPKERKLMLDDEQLEDLRAVVKEKTTSAKVVVVDTPQYSNEIEYLQVKTVI